MIIDLLFAGILLSGRDIGCVKLIMPYDEVDVAFKNALSESPEDDKIIKEFLDKING